jgi:crossover junction endodeoxyribonuclease RusA
MSQPDRQQSVIPEPEWSGGSKVRWARQGGALLLQLSDVTSQGRVYKQALDQFFRREYRDWRPRWGDFSVEIRLEASPNLPKLDLDNLAKAILDGIKGAVFFDDCQVARLLVERFPAERERIVVRIEPRSTEVGE